MALFRFLFIFIFVFLFEAKGATLIKIPLPPKTTKAEISKAKTKREIKKEALPQRKIVSKRDPIRCGALCWPTQNTYNPEKPELFLRPTQSGRIDSARFGFTRTDFNGLPRFHNGTDIRPLKRDRANEPLDEVLCVADGIVRYVNRQAHKSAYGKYIILEHPQLRNAYTLYAHLSEVNLALQAGKSLKQGDKLGIMGRTSDGGSNKTQIPKHRAHLHFEMGFRMTSNFRIKERNDHGNWNGLNCFGMDITEIYGFFKKNPEADFLTYIRQFPTAFTLLVKTRKIPDFVQRYPFFVEGNLLKNIQGWEIDFTWFGLPKRWTPLVDDLKRAPALAVCAYNEEELKAHNAFKILRKKDQQYVFGSKLKCFLNQAFGIDKEGCQFFSREQREDSKMSSAKDKVQPFPIRKEGDPILKQKGEEITEFDQKLKDLVNRMLVTLYKSEIPGVGIAAQQVGLAKGITVIDLGEYNKKQSLIYDGEEIFLDRIAPLVVINPHLSFVGDEKIKLEEGCLSFPGVRVETTRYSRVQLLFQDIEGKKHSLSCGDFLAICLQHEVDHLEGISFLERGKKIEDPGSFSRTKDRFLEKEEIKLSQ